MRAESKEKVRVVAGQLDESLRTLEGILESEDVGVLYRVSRGLLGALRALHDEDASLLTPEGKVRIQDLLKQEQDKRTGRADFNTGF